MWKKIASDEERPQWNQVTYPHIPEDCPDIDNDFNTENGGHLNCPNADHTYSGWKTHIRADSPEHVTKIMEILHPLIAKHGLGCKFANPAMQEHIKGTNQDGKDITIYHPDIRDGKHLDQMNEIRNILADHGYPGHGDILGDTTIAPGIGVRREFDEEFMSRGQNAVGRDEYMSHYVHNPNVETHDEGLLQDLDDRQNQ